MADGEPCIVVDDALDASALSQLRDNIHRSRLIGDSQLVGGFTSTRGFGVACHASALHEALERVPLLRSFVQLAITPELRLRVRPMGLFERLGAFWFDDVNAVYVNVLVVPPGGAVERHVDATLGTAAGDPRALPPRVVCVLYVDVPTDLVGGELALFNGDTPVATVKPQVGRFVVFDGRLAHEVTATTSSTARISCVAELYRLPRQRLRALPRVRLQSRGFAEVLRRLS